MTPKIKRLLVIDASVVRSAGQTEHPMSSACRECLEAVRRICHRVAVTPAILDEWNRHMSRFSRKWRRAMAARRKPLEMVSPAGIAFDTIGLSESDQQAIEKDRCLLEAAFSADRVILTRDDALRTALAQTKQGMQLLAKITWINPVTDGVSALERL